MAMTTEQWDKATKFQREIRDWEGHWADAVATGLVGSLVLDTDVDDPPEVE